MFKKLFKNSLFTFIIGGLIACTISVGAASLIYSSDVTYDNTSSGLSSTTVQGALDELYEKAKNAPSCDSDGVCTVSCKTGEQLILNSDTSYKCEVPPPVKFGGQSIEVVASGDGLYADTVTDGRYYYRGANVNNYITFNNETWRILSIESDGTLKIVRNEQFDYTSEWDAADNRDSSTSTYCTKTGTYSYGCNAWAATSNLVGTPSTITYYYPNGNTSDSTTYSGTVTSDSTMATYLNGTYYNSLTSDAKSKVVKGTFNVSTPGYLRDTETLETDAEQEKQYQWKGYVALYTVTELLRASTDSSCTSLNAGYNAGESSPCKNSNWLWPTFKNSVTYEWMLSPYVNSYLSVWTVYFRSTISYDFPTRDNNTRPVLHLTPNITLSGTGTSSDPYTIS